MYASIKYNGTWSASTKVRHVFQRCACSSFDHGVGEVVLLVLVHFTEDLSASSDHELSQAPKAESAVVEPVCFHALTLTMSLGTLPPEK